MGCYSWIRTWGWALSKLCIILGSQSTTTTPHNAVLPLHLLPMCKYIYKIIIIHKIHYTTLHYTAPLLSGRLYVWPWLTCNCYSRGSDPLYSRNGKTWKFFILIRLCRVKKKKETGKSLEQRMLVHSVHSRLLSVFVLCQVGKQTCTHTQAGTQRCSFPLALVVCLFLFLWTSLFVYFKTANK